LTEKRKENEKRRGGEERGEERTFQTVFSLSLTTIIH